MEKSSIRNVCILAHVDHGKTTIADTLIASTGIISKKSSGKLRYLDYRQDEQERKITMKSCCIQLSCENSENEKFLINLIDSPGHVDFSGEVSCAVRLCDGALLVVDVVEGLCPQTKATILAAHNENIRLILVLNKIDRFITELKLTIEEASIRFYQLIQEINAFIAQQFLEKNLQKNENEEEIEDYFLPIKNNVVFASAIDGWAFTMEEFAQFYQDKLKFNRQILHKTLWGDFYIDKKTKKIMKNAHAKKKMTLFETLILKPIWTVYQKLEEKNMKSVRKMISILNLSLKRRDFLSIGLPEEEDFDMSKLTASKSVWKPDCRLVIQTIIGNWIPIGKVLTDRIYSILPSPHEMLHQRLETIGCENDDMISYVSKMIAMTRSECEMKDEKRTTMNLMNELNEEEKLKERNEIIERRKKMRKFDALNRQNDNDDDDDDGNDEKLENGNEDEDLVFLAFTRVFQGSMKVGDLIFSLHPSYDEEKGKEFMKKLKEKMKFKGDHFFHEFSIFYRNGKIVNEEETDGDDDIIKIKFPPGLSVGYVQSLFMMIGKDLRRVDQVQTGDVCAIGGLDEIILRESTITNSLLVNAFPDPFQRCLTTTAIVKVALEAENPTENIKLFKGMKLLAQSDPGVQLESLNTGENILCTSGEIHLEKCMEDLRKRFAKLAFHVSKPVVPFRETIIEPNKIDMTNEMIDDANPRTITTTPAWQFVQQSTFTNDMNDGEKSEMNNDTIENLRIIDNGMVEMVTADRHVKLLIKIHPLPTEICDELNESNSNGEKLIEEFSNYLEGNKNLKCQLFPSIIDDLKNHYVSFGPDLKNPVNVFVYQLSEKENDNQRLFNRYKTAISYGFQLVCRGGPLAQEPLYGCLFHLESIELLESFEKIGLMKTYFFGQLVTAVKNGCSAALMSHHRRLMVAMYKCPIRCEMFALSKLHAVVGKRRGKIIEEDIVNGTEVFDVVVQLPIVESFGFFDELRKRTAGLVTTPQLIFSHWECVPMDPFWEPSTEEEYNRWGDKADFQNIATQYMNQIRRRKGLRVWEKLVDSAEKQRTLGKNK
ncbi:hypothetical protein SNEBB_002647 [Seison nebaliae]|nr:hypothetical protein SNEBB_002647 [Seison nebaliae]